MSIYAARLLELVASAVRASVAELTRAHPGERLASYALCTDDSMMSLAHVACTREALGAAGDALLFMPTDWPYEDGIGCFDDAHELLRAHHEQAVQDSTFREHVTTSFAALVEALRQVRAARLVADDVVLIVCSTDPSPIMLARERDAVRELNDAAVLARYDAALS